MTIVTDDSSIFNKLGASLTDDARVVIYDHHIFIVQATGVFVSCWPFWPMILPLRWQLLGLLHGFALSSPANINTRLKGPARDKRPNFFGPFGSSKNSS